MAEGALSIKLRCASWQQLATIYKRDLSHGTMFLRAATPPPIGTVVGIDLTLPSATVIETGRAASVTIRPSGGLSQREIFEIINRRRQEHAALGVPPEPAGGAVRVTTRDQVVTKPDDPDGVP